ncbi:MAG: hypothetical protein IJI71_05465 [Clostridia bacterium]|nr:hypothetical protein [Clostridia bacterium]
MKRRHCSGMTVSRLSVCHDAEASYVNINAVRFILAQLFFGFIRFSPTPV